MGVGLVQAMVNARVRGRVVPDSLRLDRIPEAGLTGRVGRLLVGVRAIEEGDVRVAFVFKHVSELSQAVFYFVGILTKAV